MTKTVYFIAGIVFLLAMTALSLFIGAGHVTLVDLWSDSNMRQIFFVSRVPRTVALLLAGSAMSVAGLIMQLLTQNRFVEPSLVGTTQSASLGLLVMMVLAPGASVMMKMVVASLFAMAGTVLFMFISRKIIFKFVLFLLCILIYCNHLEAGNQVIFQVFYKVATSYCG